MKATIQTPKKKRIKLKWWQIAIIAVVVSAIGGLASATSDKDDKKLYNKKLKQAPWAPPAWIFAPAWAINNFFLLLALQRILNNQNDNKKRLLILQAMIWVVFFSYGYIYFNRKSSILAAVWTMGDAALAIASFNAAYKKDKKLAFMYAPLVVWAVFASSLADYQALKNPDLLLGTKALLD